MPADEVHLPPILLPGYEARQQARAIIVLSATVIPVLGLFIFIAAPGTMGGPLPGEEVMPLVGVAIYLAGLAWMIWIYRSALDVEPDQGAWRYRSRD
jgi:hypothetical protein